MIKPSFHNGQYPKIESHIDPSFSFTLLISDNHSTGDLSIQDVASNPDILRITSPHPQYLEKSVD
jgi:hypothetical protein